MRRAAGRIGVAALPVIMWMQYHYQQKAIKHAMLVTVSIMVLVPCVASLVRQPTWFSEVLLKRSPLI